MAAFHQNVWSSPVNPGLMSHTIFIPDFVDVCGRNNFRNRVVFARLYLNSLLLCVCLCVSDEWK